MRKTIWAGGRIKNRECPKLHVWDQCFWLVAREHDTLQHVQCFGLVNQPQGGRCDGLKQRGIKAVYFLQSPTVDSLEPMFTGLFVNVATEDVCSKINVDSKQHL